MVAGGLGLILDLDGVIVDSMGVHEQAWREYLRRHGIDSDRYIPQMVGMRNDDIIRDLFDKNLKESEIVAHGSRKEELYREMMSRQLDQRLVPGVTEFVSQFAITPLAVASNAEVANIDLVLKRAGLREHFQAIVDGTCVKHPKPAPDIYLLAARELGVAPENCIVFEDSVVGIQAARAAGTRVVGVLTQGIPLESTDFAIRDFRSPELGEWLVNQKPIIGRG
jgi:beta-phosphoglucomutase